jgi:hypothetical protein
MDITLLLQIFFVAFFLNLLWEVLHCVLYTTCLEMPLGRVQRLLVIMSLKDAFWITLFYVISVLLFGSTNIVANVPQLGFFVAIALIFSFVDEYVSLRKGRWEYAPSMPTVLGVGVSPLLELAVTGVAAFDVVFILL